MAIVTTDNKHYEAIADALRSATGTEETYKPEEMAEGIGEVFDAGKQAGEDYWWDAIQYGGTRKDYQSGFRYLHWSKPHFHPKYKVIPSEAYGFIFANQAGVKKIEKEYFDLSNLKYSPNSSTYGNNNLFLKNADLEEIEDIGLTPGFYNYTFSECKKLKKIAMIRSVALTSFTNAFKDCTSLQYIRVEGVIGKSISFSQSPLDVESMKSIILALQDKTGTTAQTVTFSSACKTALRAEGATSPNGNGWFDYLDDINWNY